MNQGKLVYNCFNRMFWSFFLRVNKNLEGFRKK